jgi:hypothetical protein
MANQTDPVVITCQLKDFNALFRAVTFALKACKEEDGVSYRDMHTALLRLSEATGVSKADLVNPSLWDI